KGPSLYWLLALCGLMTLPFVLNNPLIDQLSGPWKTYSRAIGVAVIVFAYSAIGIWISPKVSADADSRIVARIYARGLRPQLPATKTEYKPMLQEFFYVWELTLVPEGETGKIRVAIKDPIEHSDDRIKVEPDVATVSDIRPKWMSGFEEPSRKPDIHEWVIQFTETLDKTRPARIVIRRPLRLEN